MPPHSIDFAAFSPLMLLSMLRCRFASMALYAAAAFFYFRYDDAADCRRCLRRSCFRHIRYGFLRLLPPPRDAMLITLPLRAALIRCCCRRRHTLLALMLRLSAADYAAIIFDMLMPIAAFCRYAPWAFLLICHAAFAYASHMPPRAAYVAYAIIDVTLTRRCRY